MGDWAVACSPILRNYNYYETIEKKSLSFSFRTLR